MGLDAGMQRRSPCAGVSAEPSVHVGHPAASWLCSREATLCFVLLRFS